MSNPSKAAFALLAALVVVISATSLSSIAAQDAEQPKVVVDIPNAVPPNVVVGKNGSDRAWRYQALDTRSHGLVIIDTATGQAWRVVGNGWHAFPPLPAGQAERK